MLQETDSSESEEGSPWPDLVDRIAEGDEAAFSAFYDQTRSLVYGLVLRIVSQVTAERERGSRLAGSVVGHRFGCRGRGERQEAVDARHTRSSARKHRCPPRSRRIAHFAFYKSSLAGDRNAWHAVAAAIVVPL